jgi:hypothetical protein
MLVTPFTLQSVDFSFLVAHCATTSDVSLTSPFLCSSADGSAPADLTTLNQRRVPHFAISLQRFDEILPIVAFPNRDPWVHTEPIVSSISTCERTGQHEALAILKYVNFNTVFRG